MAGYPYHVPMGHFYKEAHSGPFSGMAAAHLLIGEKLLGVARGGRMH